MYDYGYSDYGYGYDYGSAVGSILGGIAVFLIIIALISLVVSIVVIIAQWKLYKKAGKGGWEAIVPFYCNWVLVEIAGLKWYWFLFFFAPMVFNFMGLGFIGWLAYLFAIFNVFYNLSKKFNKGIGFAICGTLFTPICIMILGFSSKERYDSSVSVSEHGVFGKAEDNLQPQYQQPVQQQPMYQQPVQPQQFVQEQPVVAPVQPFAVPESQPTINQNPTPSFCTNCGNPLMPGAKFCTKCGKQI